MRTVEAQAYEDEGAPGSGRVVILLREVTSIPDSSLRIKSLDDTGDSGPGEAVLEAVETRLTEHGLELVISPDGPNGEVLAEQFANGVLASGTAVEVELPGAALRAEVLWPTSGPSRRRRRNVVVAKPRRQTGAETISAPRADNDLVHPDASVSQEPGESVGSGAIIHTLPVKTAGLGRTSITEAVDRGPASDSGTTVMSQSNSILGKLDALDAIADLGARSSTESVTAPKSPTPAAPGLSAVQPGNDAVVALFSELKRDIDMLKREQRISTLPAHEQQLYGALGELRMEIEVLKREQAQHHMPPTQDQQLYGVLAELRRDIASLKHEQAHPLPAPGEQHLYGMLAELRRDIETLRHHDSGVPAMPPHERELYAMLSELRRDIHDIHELKSHPLRPDENREAIAAAYGTRGAYPPAAAAAGSQPWAPSGFARTFVVSYLPIMVAAVAVAYAVARPTRPLDPSPAIAPAAPSFTAPAPRTALKDEATPLYESLASGGVSPKGLAASGIDPQQALARAQTALAPGEGRDAEEGSFWLRRYLAIAHGDRRTARALTQLGSLYAETAASGSADYTGARRMWEIAGALGDAPAMCFLGRLFELGLSVPANKPMALQWYERARDAGGCDGLDASIARVR